MILLLGATCLLARDWQASKYTLPSHWCLEMGRERGVRLSAFPPWREWSSTSLETIAQPRSSEMEEPQQNMKQFSKLKKPLPRVFLTPIFQNMSDNWLAICCWSDVFIWCMVSLSSYNTYSKELEKKMNWNSIQHLLFKTDVLLGICLTFSS